MNMPSRAQMVGIAERLQAMEGQLGEIRALLEQVLKNSSVAATVAERLPPPAGRARRSLCCARRHPSCAKTAADQASAVRAAGRRRAKMNAAAGLDLASIPDRIQSEVQRAIQRSIKGVEYIASSGPPLGSTPKDVLHVRGTMNLYHYRPIAEELYRVADPDRDGDHQPRLYPRYGAAARASSSSCSSAATTSTCWTGPRRGRRRRACGWRTTSSTSFPIASAACSATPARAMLP